jgi:hypothetical protein
VKKVREEGQTEMSVKRALKRGEMAQYFPWNGFWHKSNHEDIGSSHECHRSFLWLLCPKICTYLRQYAECSMKIAVYFAAHLSSSDKCVHLLLQTLIGSEQLELEWITISGPNLTLCTLHAARPRQA